MIIWENSWKWHSSKTDLQGEDLDSQEPLAIPRAFQMVLVVKKKKKKKKICLLMQETKETWVQSLGLEDPLEKEKPTHSSILASKIPWTEEPGELQPMRSQKSWTRLSD